MAAAATTRSNPVEIFVFFAACAAGFMLFWIYAARSERGRLAARRAYTGEHYLLVLRNVLSLTPVWALLSLSFGGLVLLPRSVAAWLMLPVLGLCAVTFIASYRAPAPFMPRWLREEIELGKTPLARPGRWDWVILWIVVPTMVLGLAAVLSLVTVFGYG